jgi:hypothetical protein
VFTPISNPLGGKGEEEEEESVDLLTNFVERMVPFYSQCLIEVRFFFPFVFRSSRCLLPYIYICLTLYFLKYRIPWMGSSAPLNSV